MILSLRSMVNKELEIITTKHGEVLGNFKYMETAMEKHNRRKLPAEQSDGVKREDERCFEPVQKVMHEFEIFGNLSFASLRSLYRNMKKKKKTED